MVTKLVINLLYEGKYTFLAGKEGANSKFWRVTPSDLSSLFAKSTTVTIKILREKSTLLFLALGESASVLRFCSRRIRRQREVVTLPLIEAFVLLYLVDAPSHEG